MTTLAAFEILGTPAPQGSKSVAPNGRLIEGSSTSGREKHRAWRDTVAWTARDIAEATPHDGPLGLGVVFRFAMPASRPKWMRQLGEYPKSTKPDIDKLARNLCDGLQSAGLIAEDARITWLRAEKIETVGWTGAEVTLWDMKEHS